MRETGNDESVDQRTPVYRVEHHGVRESLLRGDQGRFPQSDFDADRLDARLEQRPVADDRVVLGGLVGPAERREDLEPGKVPRNVADDRPQPAASSTALLAAGVRRSRDAEIQVLTEAVEAAVDLGEARASLEGQLRVARGEVLEDHAAEVVLLDQAKAEPGLASRVFDRLTKQVGIVDVPAYRHGQISPFMTTPHRRSSVPRFGLVGIHGMVPVDSGRAPLSLRRSATLTPRLASSAPIRRMVPKSPYRRVAATMAAGFTRPSASSRAIQE